AGCGQLALATPHVFARHGFEFRIVRAGKIARPLVAFELPQCLARRVTPLSPFTESRAAADAGHLPKCARRNFRPIFGLDLPLIEFVAVAFLLFASFALLQPFLAFGKRADALKHGLVATWLFLRSPAARRAFA